ncbi:DUF3499 domain-containing protein [Actinomycetospora sp. NBRC 106375]|uniref:DUF3499 domain-containing protein n=1 Tax=Actinomycetospora sp. NBRC 106375 TaxID=3032207 RepID=UPI00255262E2|nr:DUF3499 domain-containing protein [Actinomycetospora sp. NBRC 106375]
MRGVRKCSRTGCGHAAVATLTYVYSDSTAVVGPLATSAEPHSYDLCERHAVRLTAPRGWEVVRYEGEFPSEPSADDLTALAEAVREAGRADRPLADTGIGDGRARVTAGQGLGDALPPGPAPGMTGGIPTTTTGRRGHLRVLPDPASS